MAIKVIRKYDLGIKCDKCGTDILKNIEARCSEQDFEKLKNVVVLCKTSECEFNPNQNQDDK